MENRWGIRCGVRSYIPQKVHHDILCRLPWLFSPNRFICRGSNGVGKGALVASVLRPRLPRSSNVAISHTLWSDPQCKINILTQFLHFSRDGRRFLWFGASWSSMASWSPRCLPDASWMPPSYPLTPVVSQMPRRDFVLKKNIWSKNRKKNEVHNIANLSLEWRPNGSINWA
jgi:hypothetical protein